MKFDWQRQQAQNENTVAATLMELISSEDELTRRYVI